MKFDSLFHKKTNFNCDISIIYWRSINHTPSCVVQGTFCKRYCSSKDQKSKKIIPLATKASDAHAFVKCFISYVLMFLMFHQLYIVLMNFVLSLFCRNHVHVLCIRWNSNIRFYHHMKIKYIGI